MENMSEEVKKENSMLRDSLKSLNAEKIAIDQVCLTNIQDNIKTRAKLVLCEQVLEEKNRELTDLKAKVEELSKKSE